MKNICRIEFLERTREEGATFNFGNITGREWLKCVCMCKSPELRFPEVFTHIFMYINGLTCNSYTEELSEVCAHIFIYTHACV